jgi:hypothetical protein
MSHLAYSAVNNIQLEYAFIQYDIQHDNIY